MGKLTWNKIYEVYTGIINGLLAPTERPGTYPGAPLRIGSTGRAVKEVQYYLYLMSAYYTEIPVIAFDGIYGTATAEEHLQPVLHAAQRGRPSEPLPCVCIPGL